MTVQDAEAWLLRLLRKNVEETTKQPFPLPFIDGTDVGELSFLYALCSTLVPPERPRTRTVLFITAQQHVLPQRNNAQLQTLF